MKKTSKRLIALLLVVLIVFASSAVLASSRLTRYQQFDRLSKQISDMMKKLYTIFDYANVRNINVFEYDFIEEIP